MVWLGAQPAEVLAAPGDAEECSGSPRDAVGSGGLRGQPKWALIATGRGDRWVTRLSGVPCGVLAMAAAAKVLVSTWVAVSMSS